MQLPPPLHGVTAVNASIASSAALAGRFDLDVLQLQFSETVAELGDVRATKLVRAGVVAARLVARLLVRRPDAVYFTLAVQRPAIYRDLLLLAAIRAAGVARIVHLHARPDPAVLPMLRRALRGATVVLLSPMLRADLGDAVTDDQVRYVPNGIPDFGEIKREARAVPRVLFLSNLLRSKGPLVLLEAMALLAARNVRVELTLAGAPSAEITPQRIRGELAPASNYIGAVDADRARELVREHDLFVYPSLADAFPLVVLEAMRAGLPIVATEVGAIPEMLGETGLLVAPNDARALADAIETLVTSPRLRAELGAAARSRYLEHYTLERFETTLADAINSALSTRASGATRSRA